MAKICGPGSKWMSACRHYLADCVYGATDGIITTFAVVAGVAGASLPINIILILGFASLIADGLSMAGSDYLSKRSEEELGRSTHKGRVGPAKHGLATFVAFVLLGAIPLIAYLLPGITDRFLVAAVITLGTLFTVGAMRSLVTKKNWLLNGLEMLAVGAVAAAVAYFIGNFVAGLV